VGRFFVRIAGNQLDLVCHYPGEGFSLEFAYLIYYRRLGLLGPALRAEQEGGMEHYICDANQFNHLRLPYNEIGVSQTVKGFKSCEVLMCFPNQRKNEAKVLGF
jgi:hypothetical protein